MKVAYFTPLNPLKSGISDFAEEMLPCLAEQMDISLFADCTPTNPTVRDHFSCCEISQFPTKNAEEKYDFSIYQVGNNYKFHKSIVECFMENGGVLELHDISLHRLVAEQTVAAGDMDAYVEIMRYCHGFQGEQAAKNYCQGYTPPPWEDLSLEYTLNKKLIDRASAVIVHSDYARQMVKGVRKDVPVTVVPLPSDLIVEDPAAYQTQCRRSLGIDENMLVFGSFGYINRYKRIPQVLHALARFKKETGVPFHYYLVGHNDGEKLNNILRELDLSNQVTLVGFTSSKEEFCQYIGACDICLNLRYPTQGESSGGVHRMFGMGKAVVLSDTGSFAEYPDDAVVKIPPDENEELALCRALKRLASDREALAALGRNALSYARRECDPQKNAARYASFLNDLEHGTFQEHGVERFVDRLFEIGLTGEDYIDHLMKLKF